MARTGTNPGRKTTNAVLNARIDEICEKLLSAWQRFEIVSHFSKLWGVSEIRVDQMIRKATEKIRSSSIDNFNEMLIERVALGLAGMRKSIEKGDLKTAATFYTAINRIGGLERTSLDLTSNGQELSPAQVIFQLPTSTPASTALPESAYQLGLQEHYTPAIGPTQTEAQKTDLKLTVSDGLNSSSQTHPSIPGELTTEQDATDATRTE
jgi:hypothetical protein